MFFGIRPAWRRIGVDALLYQEVLERGLPRGYTEAEPSLLLEDNDMITRASAAMGGRLYKRWRIFETAL
jgi:hypothetical protein